MIRIKAKNAFKSRGKPIFTLKAANCDLFDTDVYPLLTQHHSIYTYDKMSTAQIKEKGHIIGTTAQVVGTAVITAWEFGANKLDVIDLAKNQEIEAVTASGMLPEDYLEYAALAGLVSFVPIFYSKKDSATRRRNAYLASATSLAVLSGLYFMRGRVSAGISAAAGSVLNYRTAYENHTINKGTKTPFKMSGRGYLALNTFNVAAGILDGNLGVILGNTISGVGAKILSDSEPKNKKSTALKP